MAGPKLDISRKFARSRAPAEPLFDVPTAIRNTSRIGSMAKIRDGGPTYLVQSRALNSDFRAKVRLIQLRGGRGRPTYNRHPLQSSA